MQPYPHHYQVTARGDSAGEVTLAGGDLPPISSLPPVQFGGPGDRWSPEELLVAAVADCFVLTFRAIARASQFGWSNLSCEVQGTLDRDGKTIRFTEFTVRAELEVPADANEERARRLLQKAEDGCLVTNSLSAATHLHATVKRAAA